MFLTNRRCSKIFNSFHTRELSWNRWIFHSRDDILHRERFQRSKTLQPELQMHFIAKCFEYSPISLLSAKIIRSTSQLLNRKRNESGSDCVQLKRYKHWLLRIVEFPLIFLPSAARNRTNEHSPARMSRIFDFARRFENSNLNTSGEASRSIAHFLFPGCCNFSLCHLAAEIKQHLPLYFRWRVGTYLHLIENSAVCVWSLGERKKERKKKLQRWNFHFRRKLPRQNMPFFFFF